MITTTARRVTAATAAAGAALGASVIPWSHYGDHQIALWRFPGWQFLAAGILVTLGCTAWSLSVSHPAPALRAATIACGASTMVLAAILLSHHDQAEVFFTGPIPMVMPQPWLGGPIVMLAMLLLSAAAALPPSTRSRSAARVGTT